MENQHDCSFGKQDDRNDRDENLPQGCMSAIRRDCKGMGFLLFSHPVDLWSEVVQIDHADIVAIIGGDRFGGLGHPLRNQPDAPQLLLNSRKCLLN